MNEHDKSSVFVTACLVLAILLIAIYIVGTPARSQTVPQQIPCGPTGAFEKSMEEQYGEVPAAAAMTKNGSPVMIIVNPNTGSFTVLLRRPNKMTCIVIAGENWTPLEPPKPGENL